MDDTKKTLEKILPEKYLDALKAGWDGAGVLDVAEEMLLSGKSEQEVENFLIDCLEN